MSLEIMQDKSTADETIPLQSTGELDSHVDTSGTAPATGARGAGGKMAEEPLGGEERKEADDKASCVVHEEESLKSPKAGANKATCSNSGKVRADALHERVPEEGKHLVKADTDGHGEKVSTKKEQLPVVGKNALNESQQKSEVDQKASRGGVQEGGMELVSDRERRNSKPLEKRSYTSTPEKDKQEKKRRKVSKKGDVAKRAEVRCRSPGRPANRSQRAMLQGSAKRRQKVQSKAGDGKSVEVSPRKETPSSPIKKPKLPVPKSQALPMAVKCKTPPDPSKQVPSRPDRSAKIAMQTSHISAPISTGSAQVRPAVRKEQSAAEARAAVSAKRAGEQKTRLGMTPALSSTKTASKPARPSAPASEKHPATTTTGSALRSSAPASARSTLAVKQDVAKLTGTLRAKPSIPVATEKSPRPAAATAAGPVAAAAVSVTAKALVPAAASPTRPTSLLTDRCAKPRMTQQKSPVSTGAGKKGSGTTPVTTPAAAGAVGRPPGSARTSMAPRAPGAPGAFPELSHVGQRRAQCRGHAGRGLALSANHPRREEGLSHPDDAQVARGHGAKPQPEGGAIQDRLHRQHQAPASRWQDPNRDQKTGLQPRDVKVRLHG
ncbi:muscle M-line assembly protein unc-89-like isoform X2 [Lethenteron reissneri]|uniref:muscle M-line assembly protein unc-89-like isoform X2 n=1 Tax=Lethenteron reissneri TaxID=7753 RepID=UPI002AB66AEF|nr:muscle M-line assembly protein unc-89-like isoform X2 [Lethenteron reissneri]